MICSNACRIRRFADILGLGEMEAAGKMEQIDGEQAAFYGTVYGKKDASPYEFDLVINCDTLQDPEWAAQIVAKAFEVRFGPLENIA